MSEPLLSVCLVNHNAGELTLHCLRSIRAKTVNPSYEIILVDNASTNDGLAAITREFPQITLIRNERNVGFAKANNQAIRAARGKYLLLLNNDTLLRNDACGRLAAFMEGHPGVGILAGKLYKPNGKVQRNCRSFYKTPFDTMFGRASLLSKLFPGNPVTQRNTLSDWDYNSVREVDWVSGACMMVRREVFDRIGLLDERFFMYWEDTDLCKRARDAGWSVWFTPKAEITHLTGQGGGRRTLKTRIFMIYEMHSSAYYYFRKYYYRSAWHPLAIISYLGLLALVAGKTVYESLRSIILFVSFRLTRR